MFDFLSSRKTPGSGSVGQVRSPRVHSTSGGAPVYESNVVALLDTSYSVGQDQVDFSSNKGVPVVAKSLRKASARNGITYNFSVMTFATEVQTVLPFTNVRELGEDFALPKLQARGVTSMETALWKAFDEVDRMKAAQDKAGVARAGSLVIIVTDGYPTDEQGAPKPLSKYLIKEIASRNKTRSCETFAIGMGEADDATLYQLGPSVEHKASDGTRVNVPHAVRYLGNQSSMECWQTVYKLIGEASSSMTGKRAVAYTDDQSAWTHHVDTIRVDSSKFRIVSQA